MFATENRNRQIKYFAGWLYLDNSQTNLQNYKKKNPDDGEGRKD